MPDDIFSALTDEDRAWLRRHGGGEVDGLYQVTTRHFCAGFTIRDGRLDMCAPILRKRIAYWQTVAVRIGDDDGTHL